MPIAIARLSGSGTERTIIWRRPVSTNAVITMPSATTTPIASA